jgi:hypothetical protein
MCRPNLKRIARELHVEERLKQRYGVTGVQAHALAGCIRRGQSEFVEHDQGCEIHFVPVNGQKVKVVYQRERNEIVTVLPPEWKGAVYQREKPAMLERQNGQYHESKSRQKVAAKQFHRDLRNAEDDENDF